LQGFLLTTDAPGEFEIISDGIQIIPCTGQPYVIFKKFAVTNTLLKKSLNYRTVNPPALKIKIPEY
jgi:hypothetical protein